jgi:uncharacterized protein YlzI (FlbEa/FlbD family)
MDRLVINGNEVYLNDKQIEGVVSLNLEMATGQLSVVTIKTIVSKDLAVNSSEIVSDQE